MYQQSDKEPGSGGASGSKGPGGAASVSKAIQLIARREVLLMVRGRVWRRILALMATVAFLPPLLLSLRSGSLGLAGFRASVALAFSEVALPLIGLLVGADALAGESEDATLIPLAALPVSRAAIFFGKLAGRAIVVAAAYAAVFGIAAAAILALQGSAGWRDYAAVGAAGLALTLVCVGIGIALGRTGRGRTRVFAAALVAWVVMVFGLDAIILAALVAFAPRPPEDAGSHGYGEMAAQMEMMKLHELDYDASAAGAANAPSPQNPARWLMVLDPVDLFRFTVISTSPTLEAQSKSWIGDCSPGALPMGLAWTGWLVMPLGLAMRRLRNADLH